MKIEVITTQDLENFKADIIKEIRLGLKEVAATETWLKNKEVRKMLACSEGTLVNLRNSGTLPYSKINGTLYYRKSDLDNLLVSNIVA